MVRSHSPYACRNSSSLARPAKRAELDECFALVQFASRCASNFEQVIEQRLNAAAVSRLDISQNASTLASRSKQCMSPHLQALTLVHQQRLHRQEHFPRRPKARAGCSCRRKSLPGASKLRIEYVITNPFQRILQGKED